MNRSDLIDAVSAQTDTSKVQTGEALDAFIEAIIKAVSDGETVHLIGFGRFSSGARAERTGRNPSTGAAIRIPASKTVKFTAGNAFKDAVNSGEKYHWRLSTARRISV